MRGTSVSANVAPVGHKSLSSPSYVIVAGQMWSCNAVRSWVEGHSNLIEV
ncbi:hypothetical protein AG1IA_06569 [Rhizoctonia solani AG-1 IA]|uniref:Uncharacterized protein n=1 Tax=Thanatephorus cucumeris (strain AG1-IA) TaxID=983506 RepID=L8WRJ6_THACA|nr:hypothetical protein AG1IA_06569 [Rhizoctonia solani AG-1 IA]